MAFFVSCKSNEGQWENKQISFPENIVFTKAGKDTIYFDFDKSKWKFFIYADTTDCMGCKLYLDRWSDLIAKIKADESLSKSVSFAFFLFPNDVKGTKRRYTVKTQGNNVFVDDYAHHPTAIRYVIEATRVRYPGKKIVAIFQPDRFSRGARFAKEFAQEMDKADYPYFCPFPENAKHEDGIDIDIYDISKNSARAKVITEDEAGVKELMQYDNCVFLFMSSKDIYKFEEMLIEAKKSI